MKWFKRNSVLVVLSVLLVSSTLVSCSAEDPEDILQVEVKSSLNYGELLDYDGRYIGVDSEDFFNVGDMLTTLEFASEQFIVTDEQLKQEKTQLMQFTGLVDEIRDRAVERGDTVRLWYRGLIDGEEFEGGSTPDDGSLVLAGGDNFIGDFLEQIIGKMPDEFFSMDLQFPEEYWEASLAGKDVVFEARVLWIEAPQAWTDELVMQELNELFEWETVRDMEESIRKDIQMQYAYDIVDQFLWDNITEVITIDDIPQGVIDHYMALFWQDVDAAVELYSANEDFTRELFLVGQYGTDDEEEIADMLQDHLISMFGLRLFAQALVDYLNYEITEDDMKTIFGMEGTEGLEEWENTVDEYGMPFIIQMARVYLISDLIFEHFDLQF